jgi:SAM-dependent methyltransferase
MTNWPRRTFLFNETRRDEWVKDHASLLPAGTRVLDVGAGSCPYRRLFAHCDYRTHDFQQLKPGLLRSHEDYGQIDYVGDICNIEVADATFDVILCTEVLEHIPEPIRAVKEFARILRPGGELLLTAPLGSGLHQEPFHFYGGYTPHWYRRFLKEVGFEDVRIESNGGFFSFYGQESLRFAIELAPWKGRARLMLLPVWLLCLPWCLSMPLVARPLDRLLDPEPNFTVGYHVSARRQMLKSAADR